MAAAVLVVHTELLQVEHQHRLLTTAVLDTAIAVVIRLLLTLHQQVAVELVQLVEQTAEQ
jgi:hypothetical protein